MSVYSMTGYASATAAGRSAAEPASGAENVADRGDAAVTVEMRSVNGRFLDLALRLPDEYRQLEPALRERIGAAFRRGKIELRLAARNAADDAWPAPRTGQLSRLLSLEATVQGWLPKAAPLSVHEILTWCRSGTPSAQPDDAAALAAASDCIERLRAARAREGERLARVMGERVARLRELADAAEPLVPAVIARHQQRFVDRWNEALQVAGATASAASSASAEERALAEAAGYAIRIDIAEELARLRSHVDEVERLLAKGGEIGKRLEFLIQELLREANTLGSKSAALELTNLGVEMKVAIEQLREQVQNIE